jgi:GMP synthase-like glutamine amidotransferase
MFEAKSPDSSDTGGAGYVLGRAPAAKSKKPICIVLHQEQSNPGHVGQWFRRNGHALDIRKPRYGDLLPETLEGHCGAVIFGGPMSANDKDEFICRETEWIGVALREEKPFLGICLGGQMLANHLGAKVGFHPEELAEIGYYPITTTSEGNRFGAFPDHVYQWRPPAGHLIGSLPEPGIWLRLSHRPAVPSRDHLRPGSSLDRARHGAARHEGRPRAARAHPGPHRSRPQGARLARPLPVALGRVRTHD